jgi:predicted nuclease of predicted toxin-antitoxin system
MRFLIDAQLPPALCSWLAERNHDATHVHDRGMRAATDLIIAQSALDSGEVLISKDEDFLILQSQLGFTLLWLRCGNTTKAALFDWLAPRWARIEAVLVQGDTMVEVR